MKRIKFHMTMIAAMTAGFALTSCDDNFMNEVPQTQLTIQGYFNTVSDLETYANSFYGIAGGGGIRDAGSDDVTGRGHSDENEFWQVIFGELTKDNVGGWASWDNLHKVNVFLDNADRAAGNEADKNHWIGFGHYSRAILYIGMVQRYSEVPWIEHALGSEDPDVYRASDPRAFVVEKIMEDLEFACKWIKPEIGNRTRVHKYCALSLMSRFALYEGTFRKYHPELGLQSTANTFLQRAVSASEEIMNSGYFDISGTPSVDERGSGIKGSPTYRNLFVSPDLKENKEIIRWIAYDYNLNPDYRPNPINSYWYGLSRSLMESYLTYPDGKPFSTVAGYATMPYYAGFANRDPRLSENIAHPGSLTNVTLRTDYVLMPTYGGYCQEKFEANKVANQYEGRPVHRYAEILLNYAEAKAELGQFTPADAAKSINKLRKRVGMPDFDANREVDDLLKRQYDNVTDPTILAIRRERRVELACEGFRRGDIYRWGAGKIFLLSESRQGMWVPTLNTLYDSNGDGIPDMGIYDKESNIPADYNDISKYGRVNWYCFQRDLPFGSSRGDIIDQVELSGGDATKGYLTRREGKARSFNEPKDYYRPINVTHFTLNPNLKQQKYWE